MIKRREFIIKTAASGAGTILTFPAISKLSGSPNETINIGVIGFRSHGMTHINAYKKMPNVRIAALCDVDQEVIDREMNNLSKENIKPQTYKDIRDLLDNKEIDAVSIATPNHWHALGSVWACQAGKDVCVEKPVSHNVWEGRKMVEAARKYNRMVQADLDHRSIENQYVIADFLQKGGLGKILHVRVINYKRRPTIGKINGMQSVSKSVDYNLWLGRASMKPLTRMNLHYDWHWQWETGNGEIGNNGPHQLDYVRRLLGFDNLPQKVMSYGGRYGYLDDGETPNTQVAMYDYNGIPVIYESRGLSRSRYSEIMNNFVGITATGKKVIHPFNSEGANMNVVVFCEDGYLFGGIVYDNDGNAVKSFDQIPGQNSQEHFINAVRSRKLSDLRGDIEEGHKSTVLCHLGNISYQLAQRTTPHKLRDSLNDDLYQNESYEQFKEHMTSNEINIWEESVMVGPSLSFDSKREVFTGLMAEEANRYLKDNYREPFIIPEFV